MKETGSRLQGGRVPGEAWRWSLGSADSTQMPTTREMVGYVMRQMAAG